MSTPTGNAEPAAISPSTPQAPTPRPGHSPAATGQPLRLAVFDLDGTLLATRKAVMPALAAELWRQGYRRPRGAVLFALAGVAGLLRKLRLIRRETYTHFGTRLIVRWMAGDHPENLEPAFAATAQWLLGRTRLGVVGELQRCQEEGHRTVIVSAVIEPLLAHFARELGCEAAGTPVEMDNQGRLTGRLAGPYASGSGKLVALERWVKQLQGPVDWAPSCAYADTLADLPVLSRVGTAVAVAPDRELRAHALGQGWRIING